MFELILVKFCMFRTMFERCLNCWTIIRWLREKGSQFALEYMRAEDEQTNFVCIGPVNKAFHVVV